MLIRPSQFQRLEDESIRRFENEMVAHLNDFARRHCEVIGEDGVRQVIRLGFENCEQYDFTMQGPVRFFIELMFMFGSYFDTDIQYPWVAGALTDPLLTGELFRADNLHDKMTDYLSEVAGAENIYTKRALRETQRMASETVAQTSLDLRGELMPRLKKVYPEKCEWLGEERLMAVLEGGVSVAQTAGITSVVGLRLFAVLAFALGHRFHEDPLYPWIASTMNHPTITDPNIRASRLQEKTSLYLDRVLVYLETD